MDKIQLGDLVEDKITGFKGIAICRTEWMYGCIRITVQPTKLSKDGKVVEAGTFDEPQLKILKAQKVSNEISNKAGPTYGPRDDKTAIKRN